MRQKPLSSSETHQLVCNQSKPLGWVTPERSRTARLLASLLGAPTGGLSLPVSLLTHGGGLNRVTTQGSWVSEGEALYSQDLPVLGRTPATAGGGASMIGSVVTVMSSTKPLPSARATGVALWIQFIPKIRVYC